MRSVFLSRLASTLVLWTVVLWTIFSGNELGFFAVLAALGLAALWEYYRMMEPRAAGAAGDAKNAPSPGLPHFRRTGMLCGAAMLAGTFWFYSNYQRIIIEQEPDLTIDSSIACGPGVSETTRTLHEKIVETWEPFLAADWELFLLTAVVLAVFARQLFFRHREAAAGASASGDAVAAPQPPSTRPLAAMATTLFGLIYIVWLFGFLIKIVYAVPRADAELVKLFSTLKEGSVVGQFYVLYLIVVTKFSDMGAYVTGSLIGRHKMAPSISPGKTWEGFCGALAFALLGSHAMIWLLPETLHFIGGWAATGLGLGLGIVAVVGDLVESVIKRATGTKDSGRFLPGIGGALDLVDSLLVTAPLLYFYLRVVA